MRGTTSRSNDEPSCPQFIHSVIILTNLILRIYDTPGIRAPGVKQKNSLNIVVCQIMTLDAQTGKKKSCLLL